MHTLYFFEEKREEKEVGFVVNLEQSISFPMPLTKRLKRKLLPLLFNTLITPKSSNKIYFLLDIVIFFTPQSNQNFDPKRNFNVLINNCNFPLACLSRTNLKNKQCIFLYLVFLNFNFRVCLTQSLNQKKFGNTL